MPDREDRQRRLSFRPVRLSLGRQREADRRAGELLVPILDAEGKAEVQALLAGGRFVPAVRRVRQLTGLRLIDAKRLAESLRP
jgi:ribosomal protein L7/L12